MNKKELLAQVRRDYPGKFSKDCHLADIEEAAKFIEKMKKEHNINGNDASEDFEFSVKGIKEDLLKRDGLIFILILLVVFAVVGAQVWSDKQAAKRYDKIDSFFDQSKAIKKGKPRYKKRPARPRYKKEKPKVNVWR